MLFFGQCGDDTVSPFNALIKNRGLSSFLPVPDAVTSTILPCLWANAAKPIRAKVYHLPTLLICLFKTFYRLLSYRKRMQG